jgi:hypothetical protein
MLVVGSIANSAASGFGMTAAAIAVFGFVAHIKPALSGAGEKELREATLMGGMVGLGAALLVIVLSALID